VIIINWLIILSFLFYSLNVTGFRVKTFVLVTSYLKDEPIDMVFWAPYCAAVITFSLAPNIGQWILLGIFVFFHVVCFFTSYKYWIWPSEKKITGYHRHFSHTHHIIKPREEILTPDTFHITIFSLLFVNLVAIILNILA